MAIKFEKPGRGGRETSRRESRKYNSSSGRKAGGASNLENNSTGHQSFPNRNQENIVAQPRAFAIDQQAASNFNQADEAAKKKELLDQKITEIANARKRNPIVQKALEQQAERLNEIVTKSKEFEAAGKAKRQEYNKIRQEELKNNE